jgi:small subunit ribosomal protein S16
MLKIKLSPRGKKHQITYRIVIAERRSKLNGKFIDDIGFYTPQTKTIEIDKKKMAQWIKNGAQLTTGVDKLLNPKKYPNKKKAKKEKIETSVKEKTKVSDTQSPENKSPVKEEVKKDSTEEKKEENKSEKKVEAKTEEKKEVEVKEEK